MEIDKYIIIRFPLCIISFPFPVFQKKLIFHVCFIRLDCDIHLRKFEKLGSQVYTAMSSLQKTVNKYDLPLIKSFTVNNNNNNNNLPLIPRPPPVFSIWCVRSHGHTSARVPVVWCVQKIVRTISVYDMHCLGYSKKENERKNKSVKFSSSSFFFNLCQTFVTLNAVLCCITSE